MHKNAALLNELLAALPPSWPARGISRRGVLAGLIAAPFVIRTPGLVMPVRDRSILTAKELEDQTWAGTRDWKKYPPTLDEVKAHRRSREMLAQQRVMVSYTGAGWAYVSHMIAAENRFEAMGLL